MPLVLRTRSYRVHRQGCRALSKCRLGDQCPRLCQAFLYLLSDFFYSHLPHIRKACYYVKLTFIRKAAYPRSGPKTISGPTQLNPPLTKSPPRFRPTSRNCPLLVISPAAKRQRAHSISISLDYSANRTQGESPTIEPFHSSKRPGLSSIQRAGLQLVEYFGLL
jgi:hypothetical protein